MCFLITLQRTWKMYIHIRKPANKTSSLCVWKECLTMGPSSYREKLWSSSTLFHYPINDISSNHSNILHLVMFWCGRSTGSSMFIMMLFNSNHSRISEYQKCITKFNKLVWWHLFLSSFAYRAPKSIEYWSQIRIMPRSLLGLLSPPTDVSLLENWFFAPYHLTFT